MNKYIIKELFFDEETLKKIYDFDKKSYISELNLSFDWYKKRYRKCHSAFVALDENNEIMGYACAVPIAKQLYDSIVSGSVDDDISLNPNMFLKDSRYVYISSILVDEKYRKHNIIDPINQEPNLNLGINLFDKIREKYRGKHLCAITATEAGFRFASKFMKRVYTHEIFKNEAFTYYEGSVKLALKFLMNCFKHFKLVCIHKFWVYYYSRYFGIRWQGFWHDMSKFSPTEFFESAKYYTGVSSPINEAKRLQGISYAWQHHKGRNPHHYEYWTDCYDIGTVPRKMPFKYVLELVCDYLAACRAYNKGGKDFLEKELAWWNVEKEKRLIHPETKKLITAIFDLLDDDGFRLSEPFSTIAKIKYDLMKSDEFKDY